jgi:hypothetical protein
MADASTTDMSIIRTILTSLGSFLLLTVVVLPVSYVMNATIDRAWQIRVFAGIIAAMFAPLLFLGILVMQMFWPAQHYFGLFPVGDTSRLGWWAGLLSYFNKDLTGNGLQAIEASVLASLPPAKGKKIVNEEVFKIARDAGAEPDKGKYDALIDALRKAAGMATIISLPAANTNRPQVEGSAPVLEE